VTFSLPPLHGEKGADAKPNRHHNRHNTNIIAQFGFDEFVDFVELVGNHAFGLSPAHRRFAANAIHLQLQDLQHLSQL
jgi:hypothetical protein